MLTLFVLKSGQETADPDRAIKSWGPLPSRVVHVGSLLELKSTAINTEWYAVIYDNEILEAELQAALAVFFEVSTADVFVVFQRDDTGENPPQKAPRVFRYDVIIEDNSLMPLEPSQVSFETILNGWVVLNDPN